MSVNSAITLLGRFILTAILSLQGIFTANSYPIAVPPGAYSTSWIGNSFGGNGAVSANPNGFGYWVQDNVSAMAVSDDGTVFLGTPWDEAGRTIGLYKNGQPNRILVRADKSTIKSWGFNTGNNGVCVYGSFFYITTYVKRTMPAGLLRFRWTPGNTNSAKYSDEVALPQTAVGLACNHDKIVVSYSDMVEIRDTNNLKLIMTFPVPRLAFALPASDGSFWVISGDEVHHFDAKGHDTGVKLKGITNPTSLSWGLNDELIVTDNGPAQQVLFFDVSGPPRQVSTFGQLGGLYSGIPGAVAPLKLFALVGAGVDARGNLYVAMSFSKAPTGTTFLRAFSSSGKLLWDDYATAWVDTFGFEPGTAGTIVVGRTTRWQLNLNNLTPGTEATLKAITLDPLEFPQDPRLRYGMSIYPRLIHGSELMYGLGQTGGRLFIFAQSRQSNIFHLVLEPPRSGNAWDVAENGDLWNSDPVARKIERYALQSITPTGMPIYNWSHPEMWDWPADFTNVTRIIYNTESDSLYLFGYLVGQKIDSWGVIGYSAQRYDGWTKKNPVMKWTNSSLPITKDGLGIGRPLAAKEAALAGDYLFLGMVRERGYKAEVNILNANSGRFVGTLVPGPEVGNIAGNEDMYGSIQATRSAEGEYLILVEDDGRAKNLLFRWKP